MSDLLLDTCAVIWSGQNKHIREAALDAMDATYERGDKTYVSAITAWELGQLVSRSRLNLVRPVAEWFEDYVATGRMAVAPLTPRILIDSSFLPGHPPNDPADRIIIATGRAENLVVMTRDRKILDYAAEGHLRAMAC